MTPHPFAAPGFRDDPYPVYHRLRRESPVLHRPAPDGGPGECLVTGYEAARAALADARLSVDRTKAPAFRERAAEAAAASEAAGLLPSMLLVDPPEHTRLRGPVARAFTPARVAALAPRVEALADELLDALAAAGDGADVVRHLAAPLPAIVIAELLGIPADDHPRFRAWSDDLLRGLVGENPDAHREAFARARRALHGYLRGFIAERRRRPTDDLVSALVAAHEDDALADDELLGTCDLLLVAGHETTTNLIGSGVLALLHHPAERARLAASAEGWEEAVEELLRFESPLQAVARVATEDVTLPGGVVPAGAAATLVLGAANRDPEAFPEPDRLDVARGDARHLAFGHGPHFCLGAHLARIEARVALHRLFERFPELRLREGSPPRRRASLVMRGLTRLPVHAA